MIPMRGTGQPIPKNLPASVPHEAALVEITVFAEELVGKISVADYKGRDWADTNFHQITAGR
jgi:hypothetical protein